MDQSTATVEAWHYDNGGVRVGPISTAEIRQLAASGGIKPETSVWGGSGNWIAAKDSSIADAFAPVVGSPPALPASAVDNTFAWLTAAAWLVGTILEGVLNTTLVPLFIIANITLCYFDDRKLKAAGHRSPEGWSVALVPVYLWKRANCLGTGRKIFWTWITVVVLSLFIETMFQELHLETAAQPLVTRIIQEQLGGTATCVDVTIVESVTEDLHRATATLNNGNSLQILIEEKDDETIFVTIAQ